MRDTILVVRLGSCIALEVATGILTLSAAAVGVAFAAGAIRGAPERVAAVTPGAIRPGVVDAMAPGPGPGAGVVPGPGSAAVATHVVPPGGAVEVAPSPTRDAGVVAPAGSLEPIWTFIDQPDEALLAPIRDGSVARVKFNGGGSSLSMRLEFEDGSKAAFKPDQTHRHSNPRKEIAAYRIDRLLGLGRVAPAIGRTFPYRELQNKIASSHREYAHRLDEEATPKNGQLRGELSWWIPVLGVGRVEGGYKIDSAEGVNRWKKWLHLDAEIPPDQLPMVQQLSNVTAFDFLIDNLDRWSGGNANTTEDGSTLYFMDNTMAFSTDGRGARKSYGNLERVEKFSRGLVTRLRALSKDSVQEVLTRDPGPYQELLTGTEIDALLGRRDALLKYIDDLIAAHGEDKVLAFP